MSVINWLIQYAEHIGYLAVYGLVTGSSFGLPVPEDATLLVAGYAVSQHYVHHLAGVMIAAFLGILTGDNLGFYLGRKYKSNIQDVLFKHGHKIFLTPKRINRIYMAFRKHPDRTIFLSRFVVGLRMISPLMAGSSGMKWREFFLFNMAGALVVAIAIPIIGFKFGENLPLIYRFVKDFFLVIATIVIAVIISTIFFYKKKAKIKA